MKKVLFILLIVICIVQPIRTQECTVTETESAGLADTQSRSLAASAIGTTLGALPPPTADIAGSMHLWQLYKQGAGIDSGRFYEMEWYWNEYYAAQQRAADTFANQQRRKQEEAARLERAQNMSMWGWGGSPAISMLMAQMKLDGASLGPAVGRGINEWYDAYYAAQERAMRNAVKLLP